MEGSHNYNYNMYAFVYLLLLVFDGGLFWKLVLIKVYFKHSSLSYMVDLFSIQGGFYHEVSIFIWYICILGVIRNIRKLLLLMESFFLFCTSTRHVSPPVRKKVPIPNTPLSYYHLFKQNILKAYIRKKIHII